MTDFDKWLMKEVDVDRPADWDLVREAFEAGQKAAQEEQIDCLNKCHNSRVAELVRLNQVKTDRLVALQKEYDDLNDRASQIAWDQMAVAKLNYELEVKVKALQKEIDEIS